MPPRRNAGRPAPAPARQANGRAPVRGTVPPPPVPARAAAVATPFVWKVPVAAATGAGITVPEGIPTLSLCIPTMRRWNFLKENLPHFLRNPYISEIVISDETGEDANEIARAFSGESRIKCSVNRSVLGPFLNKERAVSLATNEWVCLLDSDNYVPPAYFTAWAAAYAQAHDDTSIVYMAEKAVDLLDFSAFVGKDITGQNYEDMYAEPNGSSLLNLGNYIVNKTRYLAASHQESVLPGGDKNYTACDVLYKNYYLLKGGCTIRVVPGMVYYQVIHDDNLWKKTILKTPTRAVCELFGWIISTVNGRIYKPSYSSFAVHPKFVRR